VDSSFGPAGQTAVHFEKVVSGLEVPWGIAFLPSGSNGKSDWLVTERPGRVRLIRNGVLQDQPITTVSTAESGEGGLLGIALHPQFAENSLFYVYYTTAKNTGNVNRVERFKLSSDHMHATSDRIIVDDIPAGTFHNGGRIKFGPDGLLYIATGNARQDELSRDSNSPAGKILRLNPDGGIPADNPQAGKPWFIKGIRNCEGFDWINADTLIVTDHGPSGEYQNRYGGDEVNIAHKGDDLGWPTTWHCESQPGLITPILTWNEAVPPGGAVLYQGNEIPEWKGSLIIGTLGSEHLHRVVLNPSRSQIASHEVYFQGDLPRGLGRIREVIQGPRGELYVTTSNCDSRGSCPDDQDGIYRIRPGA
jgi:glucose/arabinose dehydrogenase